MCHSLEISSRHKSVGVEVQAVTAGKYAKSGCSGSVLPTGGWDLTGRGGLLLSACCHCLAPRVIAPSRRWRTLKSLSNYKGRSKTIGAVRDFLSVWIKCCNVQTDEWLFNLAVVPVYIKEISQYLPINDTIIDYRMWEIRKRLQRQQAALNDTNPLYSKPWTGCWMCSGCLLYL